MRKLLALLLAALMLCALVACDNGDASSDPVDSEVVSVDESEVLSAPESDAELTTTAGRSRTTTTTAGKTKKTTKAAFEYDTSNEKPVTEDISIRYAEMHSESDAQAEAMKKSVLNAKDEVKPATNGTTYYVSYKGNDANDGKSPATAWRTTKRADEAVKQFKSGDVVLFERGGVYRGTLRIVSGMKVGAYGSGPKPQLYAGPCNLADPKYWEATKYENVWKLNTAGVPDIGNIVFNHGEVCASTTRMFKEFLVTDTKKYKPKDFYYYHNVYDGYVYMYYSKGNPGEDFDSIEICPKVSHITRLDNSNQIIAEDIVVDNLCLRYAGAFGVVFSAAKNITVTNCEIGYIGGSELENGRYGNGIEFNSHIDTALIRNNWIYQCYDAGYTNQGWGAKHENIVVDANLMEYSPYNIEVFCDKNAELGTGYVRNTVYENNILRFAGYGFGSLNRKGSNTSAVANINSSASYMDSKGFVIRNNILDTSYRSMVRAAFTDGEKGPKFEGNTWIQWNDTNSCVAQMRDTKNPEHDDNNMVQKSTDQATMEASVAKLDSTPKYVKFYEKK